MRHTAFTEGESSCLVSVDDFVGFVNQAFPDEVDSDPGSPPSLLDIFGSSPSPRALESAVNAVFPSDNCDFDETLVAAVASELPETILQCDESLPSSTTSPLPPAAPPQGTPVEPACGPALDIDYELDYPEIPGVNCKSCDYHRRRAEEGKIRCSLCYMRESSHMIYSEYKCSFCLGTRCAVSFLRNLQVSFCELGDVSDVESQEGDTSIGESSNIILRPVPKRGVQQEPWDLTLPTRKRARLQ